MRELKARDVLRSSNSPVGDYAEHIVAKKLRLTLEPQSNKSFDALDKRSGIKYQIKARRMTRGNKARQLGVMRSKNFDFLAIVIFSENFDVSAIYKVPRKTAFKYARWSDHQNGYILSMTDKMLSDKEVVRLK